MKGERGNVRHYGPPLFLKRDNGAVLHTPAVGRVLATAAIVPLDSPAYYPRYNGAMEKQIGDLKHLFPFALPCLSPDLGFARSVLEGLRLEFNTRRRSGLGDCSPAELFHAGPRHTADRPTRATLPRRSLRRRAFSTRFMRRRGVRCSICRTPISARLPPPGASPPWSGSAATP